MYTPLYAFTPCKHQIYYIKVRCNGVKIISASFRDIEWAIVVSQSVVHRPLSVVRRQQFDLKAFSSYTPGKIDSKLGRMYRGDV